MASHPEMRTPDGRWRVVIVTVRGRQSFRVYDLHQIPTGTMNPPGRVCVSIGEVKALLGSAFDQLTEVRAKRFDGGRH